MLFKNPKITLINARPDAKVGISLYGMHLVGIANL
jgi:hypothetical protein